MTTRPPPANSPPVQGAGIRMTTERRNFYGRIHGKTLRASQRDYLGDLAELSLKGVTPE